MPTMIEVDSSILWKERKITIEVDIPGICNFQVCCGNGRWPNPYEVGVYLDADNNRCCIIEWPRPCKPITFSCDYGDFLVHLDTATEEEVQSATEVAVSFFRDD